MKATPPVKKLNRNDSENNLPVDERAPPADGLRRNGGVTKWPDFKRRRRQSNSPIAYGNWILIPTTFSEPGWLLGRHPLRVENTRLVDAFVGVGTKVVPLGLGEVLRQAIATIAIKIVQRGTKGGHGNA